MSFLKVISLVIIVWMDNIMSAPRKPRLTLAEPMPRYYHTDIGGDSGAYSFGYDVWDPATGNTQFRNEERYPNGTVSGRYGYVDALGVPRVFAYVADEKGYRVKSEENIKHQSSTIAPLVDASTTTTESSVTWTRPRKKKPQQPETQHNKGNVFQRRRYNDVQPPGYYLLY